MTTATKPAKKIELFRDGSCAGRSPRAVVEQPGRVCVLRENGQICVIASEIAVIQQEARAKAASFAKYGQDISNITCRWEDSVSVLAELKEAKAKLYDLGYMEICREIDSTVACIESWF